MRKMVGLAVVLFLLALTQTPVAIAGCTAFCDNGPPGPPFGCTGSSMCSSTSTTVTCDDRTYFCPFLCGQNPPEWCWDPS